MAQNQKTNKTGIYVWHSQAHGYITTHSWCEYTRGKRISSGSICQYLQVSTHCLISRRINHCGLCTDYNTSLYPMITDFTITHNLLQSKHTAGESRGVILSHKSTSRWTTNNPYKDHQR